MTAMLANVLGTNLNVRQNELWIIAIGTGACFLALLGIRWIKLLLWRRPAPKAVKERQADDDGYDPFVFGSRKEKRRAIRRKGRHVEVELVESQDDTDVWKGWVLDRSTMGLRISSEKPLNVGTKIKLRVCHQTDVMPWIDIEIRRCKKMTKNWELGCQFVRPPTWNMLLTLG